MEKTTKSIILGSVIGAVYLALMLTLNMLVGSNIVAKMVVYVLLAIGVSVSVYGIDAKRRDKPLGWGFSLGFFGGLMFMIAVHLAQTMDCVA